ncbi:MAG: ASPIC/UnbV domain-containing protein, partial [Flavobacteriales bacterium]
SAKGDLNNDGYWDFCDVFTFPSRFLVWQNDGGVNHWMKLDLNGSNGNSDAVGAKIFYWHGGQQYYTHTFNGESFFGQDSQYEILSLGSSLVVDSLRVEWPSGTSDIYYNLAADEVHELTEGSSSSVSILTSKDFLCSGMDEVVLTVVGTSAVEWPDGSTENSYVVDEPGAYWAHVTSVCGAVDSLSIQITQLPAPLVEEQIVNPSCAGDTDGCVSILLNGEEPSVLIWTGLATGNVACDVPAGTYAFEAIDENACSVFGEVTLQNPLPVTVSSAPVIICGDTTAVALLSATGGSGGYVFSVQGNFDMNALHPGDYVGVATDANGCIGSVNFSIQAFPEVHFTASVDSVCVGEVAQLQYFGSGGALPYTYDWQGQNPNALPSGSYEFSLTDGNGCTDVVNVVVAEYPFLDAQISFITNANNGNNGSMELSITGGEPPYSILWSTGATDEVLDGIGQGAYSVTVTDANDCVSADTESIIDLDVAEVYAAIQVYPNPVISSLSLVSACAATFEILDGCGRMVHSGKLLPGLNTIDCASWSEGSYVLNYLSAQGR